MAVPVTERRMPSVGGDIDAEFARIVDELTRRGLFTGGLGAAALLGLGACGQDRSAPAGSGPSAGSRSVRHKYGTTDVPADPKRVVALGYTDLEPLLGLGVPPVGIVEFFGSGLDGAWAWEKPLWQGKTPQIVGERDTYNFEKVAALGPDLIIGMYSGMTKADYAKLSALAPTVAQPVGYPDFAAPWTVITRLAGQAVGRQEQAEKLITGVRSAFAGARKAHPEWAGKTVAVAEPFKADQWAVFGARDPKVQFVEELGFAIAPAVKSFNPGGDVKNLSVERLDLLDVDQLILLIDTGDRTAPQVKDDPLFGKLRVSRGRTAFLPFSADPPVGAALSYNSAISIPFGIEHVVAALADR